MTAGHEARAPLAAAARRSSSSFYRAAGMSRVPPHGGGGHPRASVIPKEYPDCLFNDLFGGDRQALATHHPGPQRELVEDPHQLVSRQRQIRDIARKALGLGVHDGSELRGNPRKLSIGRSAS
jgi:hypothetical protein